MKQVFLTAVAFLFAVPFFVSAQTSTSPLPTPPAFMQDMKSQADFDTLTEAQKKEVEEFFKNNPISPSLAAPQVAAPQGTVNCFDSYTFGSVQVDIEPSVGATVPGIPLTFTGKLKNANPYPLVDGQVYIKIFKTDGGDESLTHQNGYPIVDQFFAMEHISLPAKGEKPISFEWNIPAFAESGDYQAAAFFMTAKRFNLLGLPFTDDVTGNKADFKIASGETSGIAFDKNQVTLNGSQYRFAAFPPHFTKDEAVKAEVKLANTTDKLQTVSLTWILSNWAGEREENRLDRKVEMITLAPKETKSLSYTATKATGSVSFLNVEADYRDTKSILNVRFVRDGFEETRINFPSIMSYPLNKGESNTLFSCLHSTNAPIVEGGELLLMLKDMKGKTIHSYTYTGGVTGAMMGVKDDFTPGESYADFTLTATLKNKGKVVEELTETYFCKDIDPSTCPEPMVGIDGDGVAGKGALYSIFGSIAILFGLLVWKLWKDRQGNGTRMTSFLFAMLISGTMLFGSASGAEAKSFVVNNTISGTLYYQETAAVWANLPWLAGLISPSYSAEYRAGVYNNDTNTLITDGENSIPVGTKLRFDATLGDVTFSGTGTSMDTPYGVWMNDAAFPDGPTYTFFSLTSFRGAQCSDRYKIGTFAYNLDLGNGWFVDGGNISVYTPFSVHPPTPTLSRDVASQARLSCTGNICEVISAGTINTDFVFPSTYGKFWYEYYAESFYVGCHIPWDILPMRLNGSGGQDSFPIPQITIGYSLTAVQPNQSPTVPIVTPDTANTNKPSQAQSFTFSATDPESDTLRYGIDWDNNGSVDQWKPAANAGGPQYVNSGTTQFASKTWANPGTYPFKVLAQDSKGSNSAYWNGSITISNNQLPTASITNPAGNLTKTQGENVFFEGSGTDPEGGAISGYRWRETDCTTGALLSSAIQFDKADFPVGTHVVYLSVQDNATAWSTNCPSRTITVDAQTLSSTLSVSPSTGTAPFSSVLTATVSGTAPGPINYTFYCNRADTGTNVTTSYDGKYDGQAPTTQTHTCTYASAGTFAPKVIVERGLAPAAQAQGSVTVNAAPVNVLAVCRDGALVARSDTDPNYPFSMDTDETTTLKAYFDATPDCAGTDVTPGSFTEQNPGGGALTLLGGNPNVLKAQADGTEYIDATNGVRLTATVTTACSTTCIDERALHCPTEAWTSGCSESCIVGTGTKICGTGGGWREVAP